MKKISVLQVLVIVFIVSILTANAQSLPNPIAHWKLDGNPNDSVGSINGIANGVNWVQSAINGHQKTVANFDGTGFISLTGELTALKLGTNFSVSVWVNVSDWGLTGGNSYYGILCAGQPMVSWPNNWPNAAYRILINPDKNYVSLNGRSDYPEFTLVASYTTQSITTPGDSSDEGFDLGIATNTWRMLTWTYDGSELKSYLDTQLLTVVASTYSYGNHFIGHYGTTNNIAPYTNFTTAWIGRDNNEAQSGFPGNPFKGLMSDLKVYDTTLQQEQIALLYAVAEPSTNLVVNGSFETPVITGPWVRFISPSNEIPGWSVTIGEIDISRGEWIAHHGEQSVDLVGLGVMGEVGQIVPTEPGASYQLSFHYANNPRPVPASAVVKVSENGGDLIKELVVTHSGSELSNMKWPRATVEFVASSSSTRISFTALSEYADGGICIDSVELTKSEGVLDTDNDGIPNANETNTGVYVSPTDTGTDPNNPDSDGDTLSDGVETATGTYVSATNTGTDPNIPDSDGDGLSDSVETNTGVYVSATDTGTNPLNEDTSGDGITDGEAVTAQFNPLIDQRPVLNFLTQAVAAQPNRFGFYNEANVMHLGMGGLMIRKAGSVVNLDLQWQTKNSLTNSWTNHGAPLPFFLNLPGSKAFIRLQASPGAP